jgi:hypothetical protein
VAANDAKTNEILEYKCFLLQNIRERNKRIRCYIAATRCSTPAMAYHKEQ